MFNTANDHRTADSKYPGYLQTALLTALLTIGLVLTNTADAQIYKYRDKDGNVVFSDTPPADAKPDEVEKVELGKTNSAPPPPNVPALKNKPEPKKPASINYETVITSPSDGSTIPMGPGNFAVTASFAPPLGGGERALLMMDGVAVGEPQRGSAWQLSNVFRGEHKLTAQRLGRDGKALDSSPAVTVYVLRPSIR